MANRAEQAAVKNLEGTIIKDLKSQLPDGQRNLGGEANITLMVQEYQEVTIRQYIMFRNRFLNNQNL